MNVNADVEQELQQFGQLLKTRQTRTNSVLEHLNDDATLASIQSVSRPRYRRGLIGTLSVGGCALLIFGWFAINASVASRAFAQVRKAVQDMRSAVITYENKSQPELNMKVHLLKSGEFRQDYASGLTRIHSPKEKRTLGLEAKSKTAWFSSDKGTSDAWFPVQRILDAEQSAVQKLGTHKRDGVTLNGFLLSTESEPVRVELWTDPDTHLPVEIIESPSTAGDPLVSHRQAIVRFEFNKEIAESLFSMTPPEKYRLVENGPLRPMPSFPRGIDMKKFQLMPGIGIGDLTWGDDLTAVVACFGPPSELKYSYTINDGEFHSREKPDGIPIDYYLVDYNAFGLSLKLREDVGLFSISAEDGIPSIGIRRFPGETKENIALGATLDEVREAYGKPSRSRGPSDSPFALIYGDKGVAFILEEARVTGISVTESK